MGVAIPQVVTGSRSSGAQFIDGSLKFNRSNLNYLKKTPASAGNSKTFTISCWIKRSYEAASGPGIFSTHAGSTPSFVCFFDLSSNDDKLRVYNYTTNYDFDLRTTQRFRDYFGWYHIVVSADTTQATASDRIKLYVNGVQVTEFDTETYPSTQNLDLDWNKATEHNIGKHNHYFDGNISNFYNIDGQALGPEYFGFTDPLTNTWRPKKYEGTFGTNGYWLPFDGNSLIGQDKSGNGNDWTPVNFGGSNSLEKATGALPILNTIQGGTKKGVGVFGSNQNVGYAVTVYNDGGGNKYYIDGVKQATLTGLIRGATYTFDTSDSTVSTHPFRFSETDGGSEYTDGVVAITGTATTITIPHDVSNDLYYYCTSHTGMGASITGITTNEKLADQYASKCILALPLVGIVTDVSNQINSAGVAKTMSVNVGGSGISSSSAASNFYGESFYWNNTDTYLHNTYASDDFAFGTNSFTIEGWFKYDSKDSSGSNDSGFFQLSNSGTGSNTYGGGIYLKADGTNNRLYVDVAADSIFTTPEDSFKDINGEWHHIALVGDSGTSIRLYIDGISQTLTYSTGSGSYDITGSTTWCAVGKFGSASANEFGGYIQDFRVYNGAAKYTSDFIPASTNPDILPETPSGVSGSSKLTDGTDIDAFRGQETAYATLNILDPRGLGNIVSFYEGNLRVNKTTTSFDVVSTIGANSGQWYWEVEIIDAGTTACGIIDLDNNRSAQFSMTSPTVYYATTRHDGSREGNQSGGTNFTYTDGDVVAWGLDVDNLKLYGYRNGVLMSTATITQSGVTWAPYVYGDSTTDYRFNFGQKPFRFPPRNGFQPLNNANVRPETVIARPDQYVGVTTYTATDTSDITKSDLNHQPDFLWIKPRSQSGSHTLTDSVRGVTWSLKSDSANKQEERTGTNSKVKSFNHNGFTIGTNNDVNNTGTYVAWSWKAGGSKNTYNVDDVGYGHVNDAGLNAGELNISGASVGTKQGFSIIEYPGSSTLSLAPHGLTQAPDFYIVKSLDVTDENWRVYHSSLGAGDALSLNSNSEASDSNTYWNDVEPTSTTFSVYPGNDEVNNDSRNYIAYLWHNVPGLQKFGTFSGNGDDDGPFIHLGFRPAIVWIKRTITDGFNWMIYDDERSKYNPTDKYLQLNFGNTEATGLDLDFLSNGFKIRTSNANVNANSGDPNYIYCAWAKSPSINLYGGGSNAR